jgi:hypothetical protein
MKRREFVAGLGPGGIGGDRTDPMSVTRPKALIGFSQMVHAHRWMVLVFSISVAITAHAQDQKTDKLKNLERGFYQSLEPAFKNEFNAKRENIAQIVSRSYVSPAVQDFLIDNLKMLIYNELNIRVGCLSDIASQHQPKSLADIDAQSQTNEQINDCIEKGLRPLKTFGSMLLQYGGSFPEKVWTRCELKARLLEREQLLPPYDFLKPSGRGRYFAGKLFDPDVITMCLKAGI